MAGLPAPAHIGQRTRAVLVTNLPQTNSNFTDGLFPGNLNEFTRYLFKGIFQALFVVLKVCDVHTLAADVSFTSGIVLVAADLDDAIVIDEEFQAAVLCAEGTAAFFPGPHFRPPNHVKLISP